MTLISYLIFSLHVHRWSNIVVWQDLFNFLRQMHLTGGANGITVSSLTASQGEGEDHPVILLSSAQPDNATTTQILTSRKRKAWEGIHAGNNKWVGGQRPPALR